MDETSQRIMAGIEASKKRNAELVAENAKRRKNEESGYTKKSETESKSAPKRSTVSSAKSTAAAVAAATTVRQHKGGGATALVPHDAASTKETPPPKKGYEPENQDVNKINNSAAKTMIYNDSVKLKVKSKRPKRTGLKPTKLTISSLRNEYQQELMKKHKKELSK